MKSLLIAAAVLIVTAGTVVAQETVITPPGVLCPDGSDPQVTHIGCTPLHQLNAIDDGLISITPRNPDIVVPNDPLGNRDTGIDINSGFGNSAMQPLPIR